MNWSSLARAIPSILGLAMEVQQSFGSAKTGAEKEAAVIKTAKEALPVIETVAGKDIVNDAAFDQLLSSYISARVALANFLTAKQASTSGTQAAQ